MVVRKEKQSQLFCHFGHTVVTGSAPSFRTNAPLWSLLSPSTLHRTVMADPAQAQMEQARAADTEYLTRRSMTKGYELFSFLTPPLYTAYVLLRKPKGHFNVNRLLRATWFGGATGTLVCYSS